LSDYRNLKAMLLTCGNQLTLIHGCDDGVPSLLQQQLSSFEQRSIGTGAED
jgi:hypothetical protein